MRNFKYKWKITITFLKRHFYNSVYYLKDSYEKVIIYIKIDETTPAVRIPLQKEVRDDDSMLM